MHRRQRNAEGEENIRVSPTEMRKASFFCLVPPSLAQDSAQPSPAQPLAGSKRGQCQELNGLGSHNRREAALHDGAVGESQIPGSRQGSAEWG